MLLFLFDVISCYLLFSSFIFLYCLVLSCVFHAFFVIACYLFCVRFFIVFLLHDYGLFPVILRPCVSLYFSVRSCPLFYFFFAYHILVTLHACYYLCLFDLMFIADFILFNFNCVFMFAFRVVVLLFDFFYMFMSSVPFFLSVMLCSAHFSYFPFYCIMCCSSLFVLFPLFCCVVLFCLLCFALLSCYVIFFSVPLFVFCSFLFLLFPFFSFLLCVFFLLCYCIISYFFIFVPLHLLSFPFVSVPRCSLLCGVMLFFIYVQLVLFSVCFVLFRFVSFPALRCPLLYAIVFFRICYVRFFCFSCVCGVCLFLLFCCVCFRLFYFYSFVCMCVSVHLLVYV